MPTKDHYHDAAKRALVKDGWRIVDEQFTLTVDERNMWIDLQAVNQQGLVILVEVKELAEVASPIEALANALGKIELYRLAMQAENLSYPLFLAITKRSYEGILSEKIGQLALNLIQIPLIVFDPQPEEIIRWIP
jgi:Holliday junction resolvase-like predicted endonuclease